MKGSLTEKGGYLYVVISHYDENGKRKKKWISTGLVAKGNRRAGQEMMKLILEEIEETGEYNRSPSIPKPRADKGISEKELAEFGGKMQSSTHTQTTKVVGGNGLDNFGNKAQAYPQSPPHPQIANVEVSNVHNRKNKEPVKVYNPSPLPERENGEGDVLFSDFMRNWLKMCKNKIQVSTYSAYTAQVNKIASYFDEKQIKLKDLRPAHIQGYYQYLTEQGKSVQVLEHFM